MPESHGRRLEDVSNLRVDGRVVAGAAKVSAVALSAVIRKQLSTITDKCTWDEVRQPFSEDDVLVGGDCQLTCAIIQPLIFLPEFLVTVFRNLSSSFSISPQLLGPPVVHSEPEDAHGEQEGVLVATGIADPYGGGGGKEVV